MRTCKKMGIKTVAVYSEADRQALHVKYADEAYLLGPPPSAQSYLLGDKIIDICLMAGVDGIHPGYGFLSENADFARKVRAAGITLIGPSPEAMDAMGNKLAAKDAVSAYNVPMVPGINTAITDIPKAKLEAERIGFPVLIKAAAGGGGKGMRVVNSLVDFEEQMNLAINEAKSAFGDGSVFIEKYVGSPRHIEIQVLGDTFGNIVYLFERECSIQRRHQKLVEEAPSAIVSAELRNRMGEAAVNVAKACNYIGAGTVEFLVDENLDFYFLEMNTRLQVEHPVTEFITGLDLVKEQIRVARGEKLGYEQADLTIYGHAIELRVCAEDPAEDFVPSIGTLSVYKKPVGNAIRVDDCMEQGMEIPIYYDNMIAKLIVWADSRDEAITLMKEAISNYEIEGIKTTLPFGQFVMNHDAFKSGNFDTHFIKNYFTSESLLENNDEVAALFSAWYMEQEKKEVVLPKMGSKKAWSMNRKL